MPCRSFFAHVFSCRIIVLSAIILFVFSAESFGQAAAAQPAQQGTTTTNIITALPAREVGGVAINTQGVLENVQTDALGQLAKIRAEAMQKVPADLNVFTPLRKVSLKRLEATIEDCNKSGKPLPDDIRFLAGLQQIRYIFVYPEQNDIILAGPGEGWKIDARGNVVGFTTGKPVMLLDDLLIALRTAQAAAQGGIACSVDPTSEGMAKLNQFLKTVKTINDSQQATAMASEIDNVLGMQQITVSGVPESSHFAQVLVAADYRMKRLGMNLDKPPAGINLPSYVKMMPASTSAVGTPRWWMEPNYEPIIRDKDGLAWELNGASVQTISEERSFNSAGQRQQAVKNNPIAKKWAENMTKQFQALALAEPIFGQLQNCMELAIVGALIVKENLTGKAGYSMPLLMNSQELRPAEFNAPKQVPSQASVLQKGSKWIITASGGVTINSWIIADKTKQSDSVAPVRTKATPSTNNKWWWN